MKRVALITVHECPLASSEGKERGGINVYTYELGKALSRQGWHVDAFTRIQDTTNPRVVMVNDYFRVIHIASGPPAPLSKKEILRHIPEFTRNLNAFLQSESLTYDALHAHYYLSGMVAREVSMGTSDRVPVIMTFHTLGLLKQLIARSYESEDPQERVSLERSLAASSDRVITSSDAGKIYLSGFYDCPKEKIVIIPPGVDLSMFQPLDEKEAKRKIGADPDSRIILAVGRIDPVKGFDTLLGAMKLLTRNNPDVTGDLCLYIVGGDVGQSQDVWSNELVKLETLRKAFNLSASVRFVPAQPQEMLPYYYNAADVLVMPSHYESFGMVALEAMACGTPVIATDVTGISELLKGLAHSHIISANNPIALSREIRHVLSVPHEKHQRPSRIGLFDWDTIACLMAEAYTGQSD